MEFPVLPIEPLEVYLVPDDLHDLYVKDEVVHFAGHGDYRRGVSSDLAFLENSRRRLCWCLCTAASGARVSG